MSEYLPIQVLFESEKERDRMHQRALDAGFQSASAYLKFCGFNARISIEIGKYPIIENLKTLRDLYKEGFISHPELTEIKKEVMAGNARPMISIQKLKELK